MSFSGNVKEELSRSLSPARHCQIAELAALLSICGSISIDSGNRYRLKIHTENQAVARKVFTSWVNSKEPFKIRINSNSTCQ